MRSCRRRLPILLLPLVLALAHAVAQDAPPDPDADRVLNCLVDARLPEAPAPAEDGGYRFEVQTLRGTTDDDRSCTVYRLRNTPGKPPTPFRWTLGEETLVDKARLSRCDEGAGSCPWLAFARYFPGGVDPNLSVVSYGLNADAYHQQTDTFMTSVSVRESDVAEADGILASSVGTELAGLFPTADGDVIALHLIVKSRFEPDPDGGRRLLYEIDDLSGDGMLGSGAVRVEWDALDAIDGVAALLDGAADPSLGRVDGADDHLYVVLRAKEFVLDERFLLRVFAAGDDEPLATVEMPAYVPVGAR